jgi:hypothetical protein
MSLTAFGLWADDHLALRGSKSLGGCHVEALFSFVEGSPGLWGFPPS